MVRTSTAAKPGSRAKFRSATRISSNMMSACSGDFLEKSVAQHRPQWVGTHILVAVELELQVIDVHVQIV